MSDQADAISPWAHPPAFMLTAVLLRLCQTELNWPPYVPALRLVCVEWRRTVDACLPALAPRAAGGAGREGAGARLSGFTGLRLLRLRCEEPSRAAADVVRAPGASALDALAALTGVQWLSLQQGLAASAQGQADAPQLARLGALRQLHHLDLCAPQLGCDLGALVRPGALGGLPALRSLSLRFHNIYATGLDLAAAMPQLTALALCGNSPLQEPLWAAVSGLRSLRSLAIQGRDVMARPGLDDATFLSHVAALSSLESLEVLDIHAQFVSLLPFVIGALPRLRRLALGGAQAQWQPPSLPLAACAGIEALSCYAGALVLEPPSEAYAASFSSLRNLRELSLDFDNDAGMDTSDRLEALVANVCRHCAALRALRLQHDRHAMVSEGALARVSQLTGLTTLCLLAMADCGDVTIVRIAQKLHSLRELELAGFIEQDGALFRLTSLTALSRLTVKRGHLLSAAELVKRLCCLQQLRHLSVPSLNAPALAQLLAALPNLRLLDTQWGPDAASETDAALLRAAGPRLRHGRADSLSEEEDEAWRRFSARDVLAELGALPPGAGA